MTIKNTIFTTIILIMTVIMINSCKKDESEPLKPIQDVLTSNSWYISSVTTIPAIKGSYQTMSWNLSDSINKYAKQSCATDNLIFFKINNEYSVFEGATSCTSYASQTGKGTYLYNDSTKQLTTTLNNNTLILDVEQLNNSSFKARVDFSWGILTKFTPIPSSLISQMKPYTTVSAGTKFVVTYSKRDEVAN